MLFMMIPFSDVNIFAVIAATIISMGLGFVWYNPKVFGTRWMNLIGMKPDSVSKKEMNDGMKIGLLATFVSMYTYSLILHMASISSVSEGIVFATILWIALPLAGELHGIAWERRPKELLPINTGHALVHIVLATIVLQAWPW